MISYFAGAWLRHSNTTHSLWRLAPIIYSPALLAPGHGAQTLPLGFYLYFNFYLPAEKLFLIRVSMCVWMGPIHRLSLIIFGTFYCILFSFFFFCFCFFLSLFTFYTVHFWQLAMSLRCFCGCACSQTGPHIFNTNENGISFCLAVSNLYEQHGYLLPFGSLLANRL